ncbi:hypothetical protein, partial [Jhaorihella thermophila]|uniref:hypothetical protein n=1 Tax=Jhaorihella thermophila TaxID=488547 RepID=UPI001F484C97
MILLESLGRAGDSWGRPAAMLYIWCQCKQVCAIFLRREVGSAQSNFPKSLISCRQSKNSGFGRFFSKRGLRTPAVLRKYALTGGAEARLGRPAGLRGEGLEGIAGWT